MSKVIKTLNEFFAAKLQAAEGKKTEGHWQWLSDNPSSDKAKRYAKVIGQTLEDAMTYRKPAKKKATKKVAKTQVAQEPVTVIDNTALEFSLVGKKLMGLPAPKTAIKAMVKFDMSTKRGFNKAVWASKNEAVVKFRNAYSQSEWDKRKVNNNNLFANMKTLVAAQ